MWYVYIIRCGDASLYTGITTDVDRRFEEHASQGKLGAKYLRGKGPLALVFTAEAGTRAQASRLEARLKRLTKADKERLVRSERSLADMRLVEEL